MIAANGFLLIIPHLKELSHGFISEYSAAECCVLVFRAAFRADSVLLLEDLVLLITLFAPCC